MEVTKEIAAKVLFDLFELTDEEADALHKFIPMKKELFFSITDKCMKRGDTVSEIFDNLLIDYPEFTAEYSDYLDEIISSGEWEKNVYRRINTR